MNYHFPMSDIKPNKFFLIKTAFFSFLIIVLALTVLTLYPEGLIKMISNTDKPSVLYEDYVAYYYPSARGIFTDKPILEGLRTAHKHPDNIQYSRILDILARVPTTDAYITYFYSGCLFGKKNTKNVRLLYLYNFNDVLFSCV